MLLPLLIACAGLMNSPGATSFDAAKVGELPEILRPGKESESWVVGADGADGSGNRFLTLDAARDDMTLHECALAAVVPADLEFSARLNMLQGSENRSMAGATGGSSIDDGAGIVLHADAKQSLWLSFSPESRVVRLVSAETKESNDGKGSAKLQRVERVIMTAPFEVNNAGWFNVHMHVHGAEVECDIDGKQVIHAAGIMPRSKDATIGFFATSKGTFRADDVLLGEPAPALSQILQIRGMTCVLCEAKVENALKAVKGVKDAKASFVDGSCTVILDESAPPELDALIKAVEAAHYQASHEGA